jgi:hypothetical protein
MKPEDWCGAIVVLRDGKRISWKIRRGTMPLPFTLSDRYFGGFALRSLCAAETARFDGEDCFDRAADWCRSFERHPDAPDGFEP